MNDMIEIHGLKIKGVKKANAPVKQGELAQSFNCDSPDWCRHLAKYMYSNKTYENKGSNRILKKKDFYYNHPL